MSREHITIIIDDILERYPGQPEYLIFLLQDIQSAYNYVSPEALNLVCDHVGVPLTQAYAVATFYKSFSLEPKGEHEIKVCLGTACHLKGGERLIEDWERKLKMKAGETTPDLKFTLDSVNCLGCCALSPVMVVDEEYHAKASSSTINKIIKKFANE